MPMTMQAPPSDAPALPSKRPSVLTLKMRTNHLCGTVNIDQIEFIGLMMEQSNIQFYKLRDTCLCYLRDCQHMHVYKKQENKMN
jgi:hypothetical protein